MRFQLAMCSEEFFFAESVALGRPIKIFPLVLIAYDCLSMVVAQSSHILLISTKKCNLISVIILSN